MSVDPICPQPSFARTVSSHRFGSNKFKVEQRAAQVHYHRRSGRTRGCFGLPRRVKTSSRWAAPIPESPLILAQICPSKGQSPRGRDGPPFPNWDFESRPWSGFRHGRISRGCRDFLGVARGSLGCRRRWQQAVMESRESGAGRVLEGQWILVIRNWEWLAHTGGRSWGGCNRGAFLEWCRQLMLAYR